MKKIITCLLILIAFFSCNSKNNEKVLYHNAVSEGISMDPQVLTDGETLDIHTLISEGLTYTNANGEVVPGLAKSWDISEDRLVWTFHLRDDIKFSDGRKITADDFKYAWLRALDKEVASEYAYMLFIIKNAEEYTLGKASKEEVGIKVIDEKTLEVTLKNKTPYFDSLVSFVTFMPANQEFVEQMGSAYALDKDTLLYSDPYKIKSWDHNQELVLEKNEHFYNKDLAKFDKVVIKYISDPSAALNAYKNGELDLVHITSDQSKEFENSDQLIKNSLARTSYLGFNLTKELFKNIHIREAFALAIDKEQMVNAVFENTKLASYTFTPGGFKGLTDDFSKELGKVFPSFDANKAKESLEKGLKELNLDKLPQITLLADERGNNRRLVENLQEQFRVNLGIEIDVQIVTFKERLNRVNLGNFDIALLAWGADYQDPMTFLDLYISNSGNNNIKYKSENYDYLISKAASAKDFESRIYAFQTAEKLLAKDLPIIPLYQETQLNLVSDKLENVDFGAVGVRAHLRYIDKK